MSTKLDERLGTVLGKQRRAETLARDEGRKAEGVIAKQEQVAQTELATATDELALKKAGIKRGGRQSLIRSSQGLSTNLAGTA